MPFSPKLARFARRALLTFAALATLVVAFVVVENWRGDRAWREYAARCAAAGDPVDRLRLPSTLISDRNFMQTPVLARWLFAKPDAQELKRFLEGAAQPTITHREWLQGGHFDFTKHFAGQVEERKQRRLPELAPEATPAQSVLLALAPLDAELAELRQAAATRPEAELVRPEAFQAAVPFATPIPGFQQTRLLSVSLNAHACAALSLGRQDEAFADTLAALRFCRGFLGMPDGLLIENMIGVVITDLALQPVWEGFQRHAWNDTQLEQLQRELGRLHPLAVLERSLRLERAGFVHGVDRVSLGHFLNLGQMIRGEKKWMNWVNLPRGWVQQNKIAYCEGLAPRLVALQARGTADFLARTADANRTVETPASQFSPYYVLVAMALPAFETVSERATVAESRITLALTACALERHRLAHGAYPESLAELIPALLAEVPRDVIDGQPLRYRRLEDGTFKLYSIGMNGKDDDGTPSDWKTDEGRRSGDWCWPQPAK